VLSSTRHKWAHPAFTPASYWQLGRYSCTCQCWHCEETSCSSSIVCCVRALCRSLMMSVSVRISALGRTSIHFVKPGVKVNGRYYREVLLFWCKNNSARYSSAVRVLLFYAFQQDCRMCARSQGSWLVTRETTVDRLRIDSRLHFSHTLVAKRPKQIQWTTKRAQ